MRHLPFLLNRAVLVICSGNKGEISNDRQSAAAGNRVIDAFRDAVYYEFP